MKIQNPANNTPFRYKEKWMLDEDVYCFKTMKMY
jgi:hypothetical protein